MPVTRPAIFLGNFADADTDEGTFPVEDPNVYLGTFGSAGSPLFHNIVDIDFDDVNNDNGISTDNAGSGEPISHSAGGTPITTYVDSLGVVSLTVTYKDGSSQFYNNAVMFQDGNGNLFLGNSNFAATDLSDAGGSPIQSINVTSVDTDYNGLYHNAFQPFVCLAAGTPIETPDGQRPVEEISVGDQVVTYEGDCVPIIWRGHRRLVFPGAPENQKPIEIKANVLAQGCPAKTVRLSPQHGVLIPEPGSQREVLVPALALVRLRGVRRMAGCREINYHTILCAEHRILLTAGMPIESLYPGPYAMSLMTPPQRAQILSLVPGLRTDPEAGYGPRARPLLKRRDAEKLALHMNAGGPAHAFLM